MACGCGKKKKGKRAVSAAKKRIAKRKPMPLVKIRRSIPKTSIKR
jgi:hypothetical protein